MNLFIINIVINSIKHTFIFYKYLFVFKFANYIFADAAQNSSPFNLNHFLFLALFFLFFCSLNTSIILCGHFGSLKATKYNKLYASAQTHARLCLQYETMYQMQALPFISLSLFLIFVDSLMLAKIKCLHSIFSIYLILRHLHHYHLFVPLPKGSLYFNLV